MSTYKITNITNLANKRDFKFNSVLDIEYVDNMVKKVVKIKPGNTVYLTVSSLPLSVHKLRVKNLITVVEISASELANSMNTPKTETAKPVVKETTEIHSEAKKPIKKKIDK